MAEKKEFTQAKIDKVVENRLARDKRRHNEKLEAIRAEAKSPDYKQEYEEKTEEFLKLLKQAKLTDAGMSINQAEHYVGYILAESEEEIETEAGELAADVLGNVKSYSDPSEKNKGTWNPFSR